MNVAVVDPAATATDGGTVSAPPSLDNIALPPAGLERVTVQVLEAPVVSVAGEHPRDVIDGGALSPIVVVRLDPFSEAVSVAV